MTTKALVADDHRLVREGIGRILSSLGFEVVGYAGTGLEAVEMARELNPDVVLMDLYMPGLDGIAATRLLQRDVPKVQVVIVTMSEEQDDILEAIQAGARGYIMKHADAASFVKQIRSVLAGGVALSEKATTTLVTTLAKNRLTNQASRSAPTTMLTSREREVLALIAQGETNKTIAQKLGISENTVRAHIRGLMQKMNLDNRTQLAVYGIREGVVSPVRAGFDTKRERTQPRP